MTNWVNEYMNNSYPNHDAQNHKNDLFVVITCHFPSVYLRLFGCATPIKSEASGSGNSHMVEHRVALMHKSRKGFSKISPPLVLHRVYNFPDSIFFIACSPDIGGFISSFQTRFSSSNSPSSTFYYKTFIGFFHFNYVNVFKLISIYVNTITNFKPFIGRFSA